jgi:hypothetical protein
MNNPRINIIWRRGLIKTEKIHSVVRQNVSYSMSFDLGTNNPLQRNSLRKDRVLRT